MQRKCTLLLARCRLLLGDHFFITSFSETMLMRDASRFLSQPENDIDWNIVGKIVPEVERHLLVRAYYIY